MPAALHQPQDAPNAVRIFRGGDGATKGVRAITHGSRRHECCGLRRRRHSRAEEATRGGVAARRSNQVGTGRPEQARSQRPVGQALTAQTPVAEPVGRRRSLLCRRCARTFVGSHARARARPSRAMGVVSSFFIASRIDALAAPRSLRRVRRRCAYRRSGARKLATR